MTHQVPSTNRDLPRHGSGNPFGLFDYGLTADPYDLSNDSGDSAMMPSEDRPTTMSVDADLAVCGW